MTTPKTPTPQGISALLRKAGFTRSVSSTTAVKGWHNHSRGYCVNSGARPGEVTVYHEDGLFRTTEATTLRQAEQQERYAVAIEAAGYAVERGKGGYLGRLIVRAKGEES